VSKNILIDMKYYFELQNEKQNTCFGWDA